MGTVRAGKWVVTLGTLGTLALVAAQGKVAVAAAGHEVGQKLRPQIVSGDPTNATQTAQAAQKAEDEFRKGAYRVGTEGLVMPKLIKQVDPRYTPEAMRAKVEGIVELQAVVAADGSIEASRVISGLRDDLDQEAMDVLARWEFEPGRLDDRPVRVLITARLEFRLHK